MSTGPLYTIKVFSIGLGFRATLEGHGDSQMQGEVQTTEGVTLNDLLDSLATACKHDEVAIREHRQAEAAGARSLAAREAAIPSCWFAVTRFLCGLARLWRILVASEGWELG